MKPRFQVARFIRSKIKRSCLWIVVFFGLSSCKSIDIQNGQLPVGTESAAQSFAGTYQGRAYFKMGSGGYQNVHAQTVQVLIRNRLVTLTSSTDWLSPGCGSSVGQLKWIDISSDFKSLNRARFAFNPGHCADKVSTHELVLTAFERTREGKIKINYWITSQPGPVNLPAASNDFVGELIQAASPHSIVGI